MHKWIRHTNTVLYTYSIIVKWCKRKQRNQTRQLVHMQNALTNSEDYELYHNHFHCCENSKCHRYCSNLKDSITNIAFDSLKYCINTYLKFIVNSMCWLLMSLQEAYVSSSALKNQSASSKWCSYTYLNASLVLLHRWFRPSFTGNFTVGSDVSAQ